jgi:putative ABC transport system permease protein
MIHADPNANGPRFPLPAAVLLRLLLPDAEREEVLSDLEAEHEVRRRSSSRLAVWLWAWRQALGSIVPLVRRGWWSGWSGFEPRANRWKPGGGMFESWGKDLRFAFRRLLRRPTYTVLAVLTLALGVAGTAAVFGIAKRLLAEPLPFVAEEEVVALWSPLDWSMAEFEYLRPQIDGFRSLAAYRPVTATLQLEDAPARLVTGVSASAEFFEVLGANPAIGSGFRPGDDRPGAEPVAVISHSLWRELGGDPGILGERLEMAGMQRTIVGVMPEGFWFPDPTAQVWVAEAMDPANGVGNLALIARMPPGAGIEAMDGSLDRITALLGERFDYPELWDKTVNAELTLIREFLVGSVRPALLAMLGAMGLILLIACVNVAALMLGQVDSRGTELAVRTALGAGRHRLLRQQVVESLLIGALAGLVGAALALLVFRFLAAALPLGALAETATVDWTLFVGAIGIAMLAATLVALVPGAAVARGELQGRLTRARTGGVVGRGGRLESVLVVVQVALVLLMASGAALLIRSVGNLRAIDPGLDPRNVAVVDVVPPENLPPEDRSRLVRELVETVGTIPGVVSAGAAQPLPLRGGGNNWGITIENQPTLGSSTTFMRVVTPGYFETMGIGIRGGRGLLDTDRLATDEGVVVINQALADGYFAGIDPVGQRIRYMRRWERVVGVVDNVAEGNLTDEAAPAAYMLYEHIPMLRAADAIVIRVEEGRDLAAILEAARLAIRSSHPEVAVWELTTMENIFNRAIGPVRQVMSLLSLLGGLALALGVVGVYGVVAHFVARRRRDWGVRIALGMRPARVVRQIVARGGALVCAGIGLGLIGFLALARLLTSFLYGVAAADLPALLGATAVLLGAGLLAAYLPARAASRIDPVLVLRE